VGEKFSYYSNVQRSDYNPNLDSTPIGVCKFGLDDGTPKTLQEIANRLNKSRERIRQIEGRALKKLRHRDRLKHLKGYLS